MTSSSPHPLVFAGPSGSGKSTLVKRLMREHTGCFAFSVSHTTRSPRPGEVNGKDYNFVTREEMQAAINEDQFIEHAEFSGNMYGTSKKAVEDVAKQRLICILDIDVQGVKSIKKSTLSPTPRYIFVQPPNMEILRQRLIDRGTENEKSLAARLATAKSELAYAEEPGAFDHKIINDDLELAYEKLSGILCEDISRLKASQSKAH